MASTLALCRVMNASSVGDGISFVVCPRILSVSSSSGDADGPNPVRVMH